MKKVLLHKRKYTYKDIIRFAFLALAHYAAFYLYFVLIYGLHWIFQGNLFADLHSDIILMIYCAFIAPLVNATLHAVYSERGLPWVRMVVWLHSSFVLIAVPIVAFIG